METSGWLAAAWLLSAAALSWAWWRERSGSARLRERLSNSARELENLQHSFSRFAPDDVIERVIASGDVEYGEKRVVTVLFADLIGFTALAESVEPGVLVHVLNGYFERMSRAISSHRGHVSTFIGDGLLAFFGAHTPNPWQADDAVHAALAMRAALVEYNRELASEGLPLLGNGIGLHRGSGIAGLVGSRELKQFAFVGRTVNVAARVQELTRSLDADVLLTDSLADAIDPRFRLRALPATPVKGVAEPLVLHALEGFEADDRVAAPVSREGSPPRS